MSLGFHAHPAFRVVGAADAQLGKPSSPAGSLGCNRGFELNMGVRPVGVDLGSVAPIELRRLMEVSTNPTVLSACPPCTGFSRTLAENHLRDDARNSLMRRVAVFAAELRPRIIVVENAREALNGRFAHHSHALTRDLEVLGYRVAGGTHILSRFGLPQLRERALMIAVDSGLPLRTLYDLWRGLEVLPTALTVRAAIGGLPPVTAGVADRSDHMHRSPRFASALTQHRIASVPHDGGSWVDLLRRDDASRLLTPSMKRIAERNDWGSHPDVYGRMSWDRPAPTIKRECGHVGNGRYAHPEQDRLLTVREMATLQGFPRWSQFSDSGGLVNLYRHIGDAVPPIIAYQLAGLCAWILGKPRPRPAQMVLRGTHLRPENLVYRGAQLELAA